MLSIKLSENAGRAPEAVPFMPAGQHSICATVNGKPGRRVVTVDREACDRLQADLAEHLRASAAGEKARPMLMFDHAAGNAAAKPLGFEWDEQRGILLRVEWTKAGREAVEGGNYGYISPSFRLARGSGEILGLAGGVEVGSLVNDPAFEKNECIAAAREVVADEVVTAAFLPPREKMDFSAKKEHNKGGASSGSGNPEKTMEEEIKKTLGLPPDADEAAVLSAIRALKAQGAAAKAKTEEVAAECDKHKKALAEHKEKSADAFIKRLRTNGNLAPKDEEKAKAARTLFLADPEQAETLFCGMKPVHADVIDDKVEANRVTSPRLSNKYEDMTLEEILNETN